MISESRAQAAGPATTDLASCDREPIHIPGSVQPHGALLTLAGPDRRIGQVSANIETLLAVPPATMLGATLDDVLGEAAAPLEYALATHRLGQNPTYLCTLTPPGGYHAVPLSVIAHKIDGLTVLELEPAVEAPPTFGYMHGLVQHVVEGLASAPTVAALAAMIATEVRRMTGFDRVLVYRFDADWHGEVIAEDRDDALSPYLGLRFPALDIPRPARDLYLRSRLRLIADARYAPVLLIPTLRPDTGQPLDLSFATLRSVAPVHREYLANMGVVASMSVSIIVGGELWGLISCHHRSPRLVSFDVRASCDLISQLFALEIAAMEHRDDCEYRIALKGHESALLGAMAREEHFIHGLTRQPDHLLALTEAEGAAVLYDDTCTLLGRTPAETDVRALVAWLAHDGHECFSTDAMPSIVPDGERYRRDGSGVLAVPISKLYHSYVIWFRPEVVQEVTWGGDPTKSANTGRMGDPRLHPRQSFAAWKEMVQGHARPWRQAHLDAAMGLRHAIIGIVLQKAEELAALSSELSRANRELEAFSYSVSHDLRAPFRHIVGYSELLRDHLPPDIDQRSRHYIDTIIESAYFAGMLVDNLLTFSQIGRAPLRPTRVSLSELVHRIRHDLDVDTGTRQVRWRVGDLPDVTGDPVLLRLALQNLLSNALKYTRPRAEATIDVSADIDEGEDAVTIAVRDNGIGFDMRYVHKLFGVFQRLHRVEDFEGTGIGLANVRRIAERHGGRVWAEGAIDCGATFYLRLPLHQVAEGAKPYAEADSAGGRQPA